jgi:nucleoside-diphosphate kinase
MNREDPVEKTFVMVKPNGVARGAVGDIIARFERRGLRLCGLKLLCVSRELGERHYAEHAGKPFFDSLLGFITSGPVVAMVVEGPQAIAAVRTMMGPTNPLEAGPGTIRGDLALDLQENVVHGSDGPESAAREIALYFDDDELV